MNTMQLAYILMGLQVMDAVLTYLALQAGAREVNPLLAKLKGWLPGKWTWLYAVKLPAIGAAYYLGTVEAKSAVALLTVGYVLIAANNYQVWSKLRSQS